MEELQSVIVVCFVIAVVSRHRDQLWSVDSPAIFSERRSDQRGRQPAFRLASSPKLPKTFRPPLHLSTLHHQKSPSAMSEKIKIAIDRGGTFTDCIGSYKG